MYLCKLCSNGNSFFFHACLPLLYMVTMIETIEESKWNIDLLKLASVSGDVDASPPEFDVESTFLLLPLSYFLTPAKVRMTNIDKALPFPDRTWTVARLTYNDEKLLPLGICPSSLDSCKSGDMGQPVPKKKWLQM